MGTAPKASGRHVQAQIPPAGENEKCQLLVAFHLYLERCFQWYSIVLLPS